jgi:hypothetical protein
MLLLPSTGDSRVFDVRGTTDTGMVQAVELQTIVDGHDSAIARGLN